MLEEDVLEVVVLVVLVLDEEFIIEILALLGPLCGSEHVPVIVNTPVKLCTNFMFETIGGITTVLIAFDPFITVKIPTLHPVILHEHSLPV